MIGRYNRAQIIRAVFSLLGGALCFGLAWLFFRYIPAYAAGMFGFPWTDSTANLVAAGCLTVVAVSGFLTWRKGGGLHSYHESSLWHDLGTHTGSGMAVDYYADRVTAPAYAAGQIVLAGPLLLLRTGTLLASLIPNKPDLEVRLTDALAEVNAANKWQFLREYPSCQEEILYLARMDLLDFSSHKGSPKIKARKTDD